MNSNDRPQTGDVILQRDSAQPHRYVLGSLECRAQLIYGSRTAAIAHGTEFALIQGVCIWQADGDDRFMLIFAPSRPATDDSPRNEDPTN